MPTHKQLMLEAPITARGPGKADSVALQAMFPGSPALDGYGDAAAEALGNVELLGPAVNDGGHTFSTVSLDYSNAPDLDADVDAGAHNLPNAYQPNPASPGAGSMLASDVPAPPDGYGGRTEQFGSGTGSEVQPSGASATHAAHTLGQYIGGKAPGST